MNRKVLLGVVIVLTLITAGVHLMFGAGMLFGRPGGPGGNRQFQNGGTPPAERTPGAGPQIEGTPGAGGQIPGGGNGQGNGGGNRQAGQGGFRRPATPLAFLFPMLGPLFILNTLGYLVLLALIVFPVPYFKDHVALAHWLLIAFAAVTFVAYFGVNGFGAFLRNSSAIIAKVDEVVLILFTFLHLRAIQSGGAAPATPAAAS